MIGWKTRSKKKQCFHRSKLATILYDAHSVSLLKVECCLICDSKKSNFFLVPSRFLVKNSRHLCCDRKKEGREETAECRSRNLHLNVSCCNRKKKFLL